MIRSLIRCTTWTALASAVALLALVGCGTTRSTDSMRTATEQLLISDAIDRAVQTVDFKPLAGQTVYLDDSRLEEVVDRDYLVSTLRQHLLASGCTLKDVRDEADFIVEARAGAVGTDRNDLLFGIPADERAADFAVVRACRRRFPRCRSPSGATSGAWPRFRCLPTTARAANRCGNRASPPAKVRRTTSGCSVRARFNTARCYIPQCKPRRRTPWEKRSRWANRPYSRRRKN